MAYVYDNKTYRNLQQQVKENMDNIAELQDMKLVGIDVAGIVADYSSLPSSAEQGKVYAVGTSSPYELYVYNDSSWVDFGEFPKAGPKGDQGPQGEPGRQGQRGLTGPQGPRGYTGAPGTPGQAGPQGEKGSKGDKGDPGPQGPAGKDGTVSFDELTPEQLEMLKGPQGPQGPQGIQGPQGLQGPEGPEGPIGPKGETGATGPKGDTGERGPQGIQGPKGDKGETGDTGPAGERGPIGPEGPVGPQGPIGPEGPKGDKGDTGERGPQGPVGPQGPKGDKGDPGELPQNVATENYVEDRVAGAKTYADQEIAKAALEITSKIPTTDYKSDIVIDSSNVLKTIYGGYKVIFKNDNNPGSIIGNTFDVSLPSLTWGTYGRYNEYAYNADPDTVEACYKCWKAWIDTHNLYAGNIIDLMLTYTDSTGESLKYLGTGSINSASFNNPDLPSHQIRIDNINFTGLDIPTIATFRIQPQSNIIYITGSQLSDIAAEPITDINIILNIDEEPIAYNTIDNLFIGPDIARASQIPTKTSQLTNDSNFVTSEALSGYATENWVGQQGYLTSVAWGDITDKPTLSTVATTGSYNDLSDKPTIPTATSQLDNDSNFITNAALTGYATETWVGEKGYQTASQVSTALSGYATTSEVSTAVSTAISSQTKETWTFTLSDGSTVTKSVVLGA